MGREKGSASHTIKNMVLFGLIRKSPATSKHTLYSIVEATAGPLRTTRTETALKGGLKAESRTCQLRASPARKKCEVTPKYESVISIDEEVIGGAQGGKGARCVRTFTFF